jgi:pimeloyl-ACP methyl ester carboxylesterase
MERSFCASSPSREGGFDKLGAEPDVSIEGVQKFMRLLTITLLFAIALCAADATYDGARVHYESHGTGKEAIVFIHGWTCDLTFWRGQAPVYEKHRTLLVDLPGHGRSDKPDVAYTMDRFARAIEAVMRDAHVESAVLVGHSMGGPVAFTFQRLFPAKTKALVLVDAFIPDAPKDDAERAKQDARMKPFIQSFREPNYKETAGKMIESMFSEKTTPAQRDEIRSKMLATPQQVMASAMDGMFAMEQLKPAETYTLPVLAIMAAAPGRVGYDAKLRAVFPNLEYEEWQGSGHFLMMESPDRFNRSLEQFLAGLNKDPKAVSHRPNL